MSEETIEATETETETRKSGGVAKPNILTRESDAAVRPGFRNPANAKTKAMRKGKGKR